jgi:osmotically-inducible protein OsmY
MNQRLLQWTLVLLLFSPAMVAQQPGSGRTMPSVSDDNTPNNKSDHHQKSTKDVAEKLQKDLDNKNAAYAGSKIRAVVDDQSVTLSGTVTSQSQHEMAMQLAKAYAGDRRIVDRLVVQQ